MDTFKSRRAKKFARVRARRMHAEVGEFLSEMLIYFVNVIGLPFDAVKKIRNEQLSHWWQTVVHKKTLKHKVVGLFGGVQRPWAGTQRMVNKERIFLGWSAVAPLPKRFYYQFHRPTNSSIDTLRYAFSEELAS